MSHLELQVSWLDGKWHTFQCFSSQLEHSSGCLGHLIKWTGGFDVKELEPHVKRSLIAQWLHHSLWLQGRAGKRLSTAHVWSAGRARWRQPAAGSSGWPAPRAHRVRPISQQWHHSFQEDAPSMTPSLRTRVQRKSYWKTYLNHSS